MTEDISDTAGSGQNSIPDILETDLNISALNTAAETAEAGEKNQAAEGERTWGVIPGLVRIDTLQIEAEGDKSLVDFIRYRKDNAYTKRTTSVFPGARQIADVGEWIKFHPPGSDPGLTIKRFLENNSILLYPMISMKDDRLDIQLKMITEFSRDEVSAKIIIDELRKINKPNLFKYLEWRSRNPREIPAKYEKNPGQIIDYSADFTQISVVQDLVNECNEALKNQLSRSRIKDVHIQKANLDIFKNDIIYSTEHLLQPVMLDIHNGLYLAAHEGYIPGEAVIPHMEVVYVYRIVGDVLENYINQFSEKLQKQGYDQLQMELKDYHEQNPPEPGKVQNRKRIFGLIEAAESHLKKIKSPNQWLIGLIELIDAFKQICLEMDKELIKEAEEKIMAKVSEITAAVNDNSRDRGLLTKVVPDKIFTADDFNEKEKTDLYSAEVINRLMHNPEFCSCRIEDSGEYYFAWLVFFLKVEAKAEKNKRKSPEEYYAVQEIKGNLHVTHPENNDYPEMLKQYSQKANKNYFEMAMYEIKDAKIEEERELIKLRKDYRTNHIAGAALGTISSLLGIGFGSAFAVVFGMGVFVTAVVSGISLFLAGYFSGRRYFSREKELERQKIKEREDEYLDLKNKKEREEKAKEINPIHKMAEQTFNIVFPPQFESYLDRTYTTKTLEETIEENIESFKKMIPKLAKEDDAKAVSELVYAVKNHPDTAQIIVPPQYAVSGFPDSMIIKKSDLRSEAARRQLADYYLDLFHNKDAMLARKNPQVAGYYRFFINTFETSEYKKYL